MKDVLQRCAAEVEAVAVSWSGSRASVPQIQKELRVAGPYCGGTWESIAIGMLLWPLPDPMSTCPLGLPEVLHQSLLYDMYLHMEPAVLICWPVGGPCMYAYIYIYVYTIYIHTCTYIFMSLSVCLSVCLSD